ncbi:MAG: hypothetical protein EBY83_01630 [Verrucomicrobia bacterium]|nr:hypothetical protein [Verrucomicrobiota bacterium]
MTDSRLARQTAERLIGSRAQLLKFSCLLGFDGFIDSILQVVDQRQTATKYLPYTSVKPFAKKLGEAAGKSANFEVVPTMEKIGGNGPLMAFAMSTLGAPVEYMGMCGYPKLHPVFTEFAKRAKVHSFAEPAQTSALEFNDGKIMLGQLASVQDANWETMQARLGDKVMQKLWSSAAFVGMVNWTMLPHMSAIWKKLLTEYKPVKPDKRKHLFFDLADPAKRIEADLLAALKIIGRLRGGTKTPKACASLAGAIREKMGVQVVVIHPIQYACAADAEGEVFVTGPYTSKPKISTGAGDHFNAGFSIARLLGLGLPHSLQLAVAASGFYVRHGNSPNREQLVRFLQTL